MKDLNYYKSLEYTLRIEPDPEGGFVASIPDLPGCMAFGETKQEAIASLENAKGDWLESYLTNHAEAPEPQQPSQFSGKLLLRMPKYLHQRLNEQACEQGVSLNQYIVLRLAETSSSKLNQPEQIQAEQFALALQSLLSKWTVLSNVTAGFQQCNTNFYKNLFLVDPIEPFRFSKSHYERSQERYEQLDERTLNKA
jgi:antitoxin HicB